MSVVLTNNAVARLASSLSSGATTLSVTAGDGGKFPSPTAGQWFPITLIKSSGSLEIARCTGRSGDVFTVVRGQESTSSQSFAAGDRVELRLTAAAFSDLQTLIGEALRKDDNLASLADKALSRDNLELKTGAVTEKQTSTTDVTAGRLLIVGAHGVGGGVAASGVANLNSSVVGSVIEVNGVNSDAVANSWPSLTTFDGADANTPVRYEVTTFGSDLYTVQRAVFMLSSPARAKGRCLIRVRVNGTWQTWVNELVEGAYGIGRTPTLLTSTDNLNSVNVYGRYRWESGSLPANSPFSNKGYVDVTENNGTDYVQFATDRVTFQLWKRTSANGSTWSTWALVGGKMECTAWVNFNGTGTLAIRDSYNVSSITDNGTGDYTINFSTPMVNANYCPLFSTVGGTLTNTSSTVVVAGVLASGANLKTVNSLRIQVGSTGTALLLDSAEVNATIIGGK